MISYPNKNVQLIKKAYAREFTFREKILLLILGLIILALVYYIAVDAPVRSGVNAANIERESLQTEVDAVNDQISEIETMQSELETIRKSGVTVSKMPSYNGEKNEVDFLHTTLASTIDYYIGFTDVTREGEQIRRNFSLQFRTVDYRSAITVLYNLEQSDIRCLIGDVSVNPAQDAKSIDGGASVQVSCTGTFFETMYDGVPDDELPPDSLAEEEEETD